MSRLVGVRSWIETGDLDLGVRDVRMTAKVIVEVRAEDGKCGYGYTYQFNEGHAAGVVALVNGMAPALIGEEAADRRLIWSDLDRRHLSFLGTSGFGRWAQAVLDMALWDLWCKEMGFSLTELVGVATSSVPTYFSTFLAASRSPAEA